MLKTCLGLEVGYYSRKDGWERETRHRRHHLGGLRDEVVLGGVCHEGFGEYKLPFVAIWIQPQEGKLIVLDC